MAVGRARTAFDAVVDFAGALVDWPGNCAAITPSAVMVTRNR